MTSSVGHRGTAARTRARGLAPSIATGELAHRSGTRARRSGEASQQGCGRRASTHSGSSSRHDRPRTTVVLGEERSQVLVSDRPRLPGPCGQALIPSPRIGLSGPLAATQGLDQRGLARTVRLPSTPTQLAAEDRDVQIMEQWTLVTDIPVSGHRNSSVSARASVSRGGRPIRAAAHGRCRGDEEMTSTRVLCTVGPATGRTDDRTPSNSLAGCSPRTFRRERARRSGSVRPSRSHSGNESKMGSACPAPWQRWLDQVYSHGSATIAARTGLASMYLRTTSRWSPSRTTGGRAARLDAPRRRLAAPGSARRH